MISGAIERYMALAGPRLKALPGRLRQAEPSRFDNIVVAMSSGVDSSTCAALYASYPNARAVYMRNWSNNQLDDGPKHCDEQDWKDAQGVAQYLGIPLSMANFEQEYWIDVFEKMLEGYTRGATPNPDVLCNRYVKFGSLRAMLDREMGHGNYWLVTGHYARVLENQDTQRELGNRDTQRESLLRGLDPGKDQSYYLSQVTSGALNNTLLPLGHLYKSEVRDLAGSLAIPTATKRDSQGICFVNNSQGAGKFRDFLKEYLPETPGNIITEDGRVWAQHQGLWSHTLGQRVSGLSMPQGSPEYQGTWYVGEKRQEPNELVIVRGRDNEKLYRDTALVQQFEPLGMTTSEFEKRVTAALERGSLLMRYRSLQEPALVAQCSVDGARIQVVMSEKQRAMAVGQYCCLHDGDEILGSGPISSTA